MAQTLMKYAIRMSTRPTPFGEFASIGIGTFSDKNHINSSTKRKLWVSLDALTEATLIERLTENEIVNNNDTLIFALNGTIICKGEYIYYVHPSKNKKQIFTAIEYNNIIHALSKRKQKTYSYNTLDNIIFGNTNIEYDIRRSFIYQLIQSHIIIPYIRPEAMAKSCIERISVKSEESINAVSTIKDILSKIKSHKKIKDIETRLAELSECVMNNQRPANNLVQLVSYICNKQAINESISKKVLDSIDFFSKIAPHNKMSSNLLKFIRDFQNRYEQRSIPLLEVLNPEIGIGYGNSTQAQTNDLLVDIHSSPKTVLPHFFLNDQFEMLLNEKYNKSKNKPIRLSDKDVEGMETKINQMPASMSAVFSLIGDNNDIISELHFSGSSATCLLGRFTLGDRRIHNIVKSIAQHEQNYYNQNGIVAEINLLPNVSCGNVNYRSNFRKYRLCSTHSSSSYDIPLSNLVVSIENGYVKLKDIKSGKYIIPRLSSAHNNYAGTDSIYQFLGDIQNQNEIGGMFFSWGNLRRFYNHFPRVYYNDIIIGLEEWTANTTWFKEGSKLDCKKYLNWVKINNVPRYVKLIEGDNELLIDHNCEMTVKMLLNEIKRKDKIILREYPYIERICQFHKKQYGNQIIIPILKIKST